MLKAIVALAFLALCSGAKYNLRGGQPKKIVARTGRAQARHSGGDNRYEVSFSSMGVPDENFVDLTTVNRLRKVECNKDMTTLTLTFSRATYVEQFASTLANATEEMFVVGGDKFEFACGSAEEPMGIRRVVSVVTEGGKDTMMNLVTVTARYDELFEDASIQLGPSGSSQAPESRVSRRRRRLLWRKEKQVCIGINTVSESNCDRAGGSVPMYSSEYLDLECSNCFAGFHTDIFLNVDIKDFKLQKVEGGFKDMYVNSALVLAATAKIPDFSSNVDKPITLMSEKTLISFKVGKVPFNIKFAAPVQVTADTMLQAEGAAETGINAKLSLGDMYLSWSPETSWQTHTPKTSLNVHPYINGDASFSGSLSLAVTPNLKMEVENVFTYSLTISPQLEAHVDGNTANREICTDVKYSLSVEHEAQFSVNINWIFFKRKISKHFGPKILYDSGERQLEQRCVRPKRN